MFNERSEDYYPDVTFCFNGGHLKEATEELPISQHGVSEILKGNADLEEKDPKSFEAIATSNADAYFIGLQDILNGYTFTTSLNVTSYHVTDHLKENVKNQKPAVNPFFATTHQDPDKVCFTRHSKLERGNGITRKEDNVAFSFKQKNQGQVRLIIFLHHPGQFIRHKESPVAESTLDSDENSQKITITVPGITTLRKRSTDESSCEKNPIDDGISFRQKVMEEVGCKPSYWNSLVNETEHSHICNTSSKLQEVYDNIRTPTKLLSTSPAPCTAMLIPLSIQKDQLDDKGKFDISIIYSTTEYQEIENHREFDFNSMFAGIGGFVGIFCGYSLFQVTYLREMSLLRKLSAMSLVACSWLVMLFTSPFFGGIYPFY